jgi:hypothetical protein
MRIVLFEFLDEIEQCIKEYGKEFIVGNDVIVLALHPKVFAFLKQRNIPCQDTIPYLNNEAQHRIILKSEEWTLKIVEQIKIKDQFGIEQGYRETCIHHLRLYFNHYLWVLEILKNIHHKYQVSEMCASIPQHRDRMYFKKGYIQRDERFFGLLTKDFCEFHGLKFHGFTFKAEKESFLPKIHLAIVRFLSQCVAFIYYFCLGF